MKKYLLIITLLTAIACEETTETRYGVDPSLESYVATFFDEVSERGVTLEQKNLIVQYGNSQSVADARIIDGQRYLIVPTGIQSPFEGHVFNALGGLLLHKRVPITDVSVYNRETFFNSLVN